MPEIGPMELLVVAVIALIVFGPEKLPEMARKAGHFFADMRRMASDMRSEFRDIDADEDDSFDPQDEKSTFASEADEAERAEVKATEGPIVHKETRRPEPGEG